MKLPLKGEVISGVINSKWGLSSKESVKQRCFKICGRLWNLLKEDLAAFFGNFSQNNSENKKSQNYSTCLDLVLNDMATTLCSHKVSPKENDPTSPSPPRQPRCQGHLWPVWKPILFGQVRHQLWFPETLMLAIYWRELGAAPIQSLVYHRYTVEVELHHFLFRFKLLLTNNNTQKKTLHVQLKLVMTNARFHHRFPRSRQQTHVGWPLSEIDS